LNRQARERNRNFLGDRDIEVFPGRPYEVSSYHLSAKRRIEEQGAMVGIQLRAGPYYHEVATV